LKDPEYMLKFHAGHNNQLRLLHYPPIPAAELENETSARMPAHSDWGSITMLFQDDCGGLEVESQHVPGEFIKVTPMKNAIVMNIGDMLMRWSNGKSASVLDALLMLTFFRLPQVDTPSGDPASSPRSLHRCRKDDSSKILHTVFRKPECRCGH
jgi:hypothetical protein